MTSKAKRNSKVFAHNITEISNWCSCVCTHSQTHAHTDAAATAQFIFVCVSVYAQVCVLVYIYSICIYVCVFVCALSVCNRNQRKISILIISEQAPTPTSACITPAQCAINCWAVLTVILWKQLTWFVLSLIVCLCFRRTRSKTRNPQTVHVDVVAFAVPLWNCVPICKFHAHFY